MTGPEHYQQAEGLLDKAIEMADADNPVAAGATISLAQVHATLALAAAFTDVHPTSMWAEVTRP